MGLILASSLRFEQRVRGQGGEPFGLAGGDIKGFAFVGEIRFRQVGGTELGQGRSLRFELGQFPLGLSLGSSIGFKQRVLGQGGALLGWVGGDIKGSPLLVILGHVGGTELVELHALFSIVFWVRCGWAVQAGGFWFGAG